MPRHVLILTGGSTLNLDVAKATARFSLKDHTVIIENGDIATTVDGRMNILNSGYDCILLPLTLGMYDSLKLAEQAHLGDSSTRLILVSHTDAPAEKVTRLFDAFFTSLYDREILSALESAPTKRLTKRKELEDAILEILRSASCFLYYGAHSIPPPTIEDYYMDRSSNDSNFRPSSGSVYRNLPETLTTIDDNAQTFQMMYDRVRGGKAIPFVGAGFSIPSGYPGWTDFLLSEGARLDIRQTIEAQLRERDYEGAATTLDRELAPQGLARRIRLIFGEEVVGRQIGGAASYLLRAFRGSVVTTNFDTVIERVAAAQAIRIDTAWGARIGAVREAVFGVQRLLLKLHGDARDETDRVLTREEYDRFYGPDPLNCDSNKQTVQVLLRLFDSTNIVFLGCSLGSDRTLRVLAAARSSPAAPEHFAIVERPDDPAQLSARRRHLESFGIHPLWYPAGRHESVTDFVRALTP